MCSRHEQLPHIIGAGAQWVTTNVRQKATVVCKVRGSRSDKYYISQHPMLYYPAIMTNGQTNRQTTLHVLQQSASNVLHSNVAKKAK